MSRMSTMFDGNDREMELCRWVKLMCVAHCARDGRRKKEKQNGLYKLVRITFDSNMKRLCESIYTLSQLAIASPIWMSGDEIKQGW